MKSKINIYEYPEDVSLLPEYRIAVMQAALEGKITERFVSFGWCQCIPCWDWYTEEYRIAKPTIAPGHNPDNLSVEQVGEGCRLLDKEEIAEIQKAGYNYFDVAVWNKSISVWTSLLASPTFNRTYRTSKPPGYFLPKPSITPRNIVGLITHLIDKRESYNHYLRTSDLFDHDVFFNVYIEAENNLEKALTEILNQK